MGFIGGLRLLLISCSICTFAQMPFTPPESASTREIKPLRHSTHFSIVTNNLWASKAAETVLKQGGNAVDAAICAALVLGLTEPQSSGLGGGGYALVYQARTHQLSAFDGRETAPAFVTPDLFLDKLGHPLPFKTAQLNSKSIGVPGEVALLWQLHEDYGHLPWTALFSPAIQLAERGFPMSPRLRHLLEKNQVNLTQNPTVKRIFFNRDNTPKALQTLIINHDYAHTLREIAKNPHIFYSGRLAAQIVQSINRTADTPLFKLTDLSQYQVQKAPALCMPYQHSRVCTTPFASGGVTTLELLALYSDTKARFKGFSTETAYRFLEASKLAFADRNQYIEDATPSAHLNALLDPNYIHARAAKITKKALKTPVKAGRPAFIKPPLQTADRKNSRHGTTSLAIVDQEGNAISMTLSVEHEFGSQHFVAGFFLNNELTDFAFSPTPFNGLPPVNAVTPGARPRSAISTVMIFNAQNQLRVVTGSPGGGPIICYVAKTILAVLDFGLDPAKAAAMGNLCAMNEDALIESPSELTPLIPALTRRGEVIHPTELTSGIVSIVRDFNHNRWIAAADPRREGVALGD